METQAGDRSVADGKYFIKILVFYAEKCLADQKKSSTLNNRYNTFRCQFDTKFPEETILRKERKYMTYEEFLSGLEKAIFVQRREEETIKRVQVLKNNGVQLDGFSCVMEGHREQPTVYVNHYFREDVTKEDLCTLAAMVLKIQRDSMLHQTGDFEMLLDYEKMKKRIYCRLISRNKNEDLLKTVPWIPWMDLAIVFYMEIPGKLIKNATALIRTAHMERWKITEDQLFERAKKNLQRRGFRMVAMTEFLGDQVECPDAEMYILNTKKPEFGAAVFVDSQVRRICARQIGGSYYILPSSIHELILLPDKVDYERKELDELVRQVNSQCVEAEDFLSDHAYYYNAQKDRIEF